MNDRTLDRGVRPPTEMELTDPYHAYEYARDVLRAPFPAGEGAIAKDPYSAFFYALNVLRAPFPAGEAAIAKKADWAYEYARDVLRAPFPAGEAAIATDPWWLEMYKAFVRRWKENHEEFMKDLDSP